MTLVTKRTRALSLATALRCATIAITAPGAGSVALNLKPPQTIILIAAAVSLTCACGIPLGPQDHYPPPSVKRSLHVDTGSLYTGGRIGFSAKPITVGLENISDHSVELDTPSLYSIHHGETLHLDTTCGSVLPAGATCFITITFKPTKPGDSEARLLFSAKPAESYGLIINATALRP